MDRLTGLFSRNKLCSSDCRFAERVRNVLARVGPPGGHSSRRNAAFSARFFHIGTPRQRGSQSPRPASCILNHARHFGRRPHGDIFFESRRPTVIYHSTAHTEMSIRFSSRFPVTDSVSHGFHRVQIGLSLVSKPIVMVLVEPKPGRVARRSRFSWPVSGASVTQKILARWRRRLGKPRKPDNEQVSHSTARPSDPPRRRRWLPPPLPPPPPPPALNEKRLPSDQFGA